MVSTYCTLVLTYICTSKEITRARLRVVQLVITICFYDDNYVCLCKASNPWGFKTTISLQISIIYESIRSSMLKYIGIVPTRVKDYIICWLPANKLATMCNTYSTISGLKKLSKLSFFFSFIILVLILYGAVTSSFAKYWNVLKERLRNFSKNFLLSYKLDVSFVALLRFSIAKNAHAWRDTSKGSCLSFFRHWMISFYCVL